MGGSKTGKAFAENVAATTGAGGALASEDATGGVARKSTPQLSQKIDPAIITAPHTGQVGWVIFASFVVYQGPELQRRF
jgi:hypothetical protein